MRSSVAAVISLNRDRFLKTLTKTALHGTVRGIPILVRGSGGPGGFGILSNTFEEINDIDTEMSSLDGEMKSQIPSDSFVIANNAIIIKPELLSNNKVRFYALSWIPFTLQWKSYRDDQSSFIKSLIRSGSIYINTAVWDSLQDYRKKMIAMREKALESNFSFTGPEPTPPKENIIQEAGKALKAPVAEIWKVIKFIIYAGVIIIGVALFIKIAGGMKQDVYYRTPIK